MNRRDAEAHAALIWPGRVQAVEPKPYHKGAWYVRLTGDQVVHMLDEEGRADCHTVCAEADAARRPATRPDFLA